MFKQITITDSSRISFSGFVSGSGFGFVSDFGLVLVVSFNFFELGFKFLIGFLLLPIRSSDGSKVSQVFAEELSANLCDLCASASNRVSVRKRLPLVMHFC